MIDQANTLGVSIKPFEEGTRCRFWGWFTGKPGSFFAIGNCSLLVGCGDETGDSHKGKQNGQLKRLTLLFCPLLPLCFSFLSSQKCVLLKLHFGFGLVEVQVKAVLKCLEPA